MLQEKSVNDKALLLYDYFLELGKFLENMTNSSSTYRLLWKIITSSTMTLVSCSTKFLNNEHGANVKTLTILLVYKYKYSNTSWGDVIIRTEGNKII